MRNLTWEHGLPFASAGRQPSARRRLRTLLPGDRTRYINTMKPFASTSQAAVAKLALAAAALAGATGLAFAGWMNHGAGIFTTMVDAGLSWCF
jgi:hypothetical protein